jgi:hypothetical protein
MATHRSITDRLIKLAEDLANERAGFFEIAGPGRGDNRTNEFMVELNARARRELGDDFGEKVISGATNLRVDFYIPDEETILEVALSLRNPSSEFERDLLKAILAKDSGKGVKKLILLCKPGGEARHAQRSSVAFMEWLRRTQQIEVSVRDLEILELLPESET